MFLLFQTLKAQLHKIKSKLSQLTMLSLEQTQQFQFL